MVTPRLGRLDFRSSPGAAGGRSRIRVWFAAGVTVGAVGLSMFGTASPALAAVPSPISITSSQCPTDITEGEVDGCVTGLQQLLNQHGAGLAVDGDFGPATTVAVKNYQSAHGLGVDGIVGPSTKSSLTGSTGGPPAAISLSSSQCPTDITEGEFDGCVTELQQLLDEHGANVGVDGDFGSATLTAVEDYQITHGLSVDGVVGPSTKGSLDGTGAPTGPTPPPPSGATLQKIVSYAQAIEAGSAETGWGGGRIQYVWGGGHTGTPGPSTGTCVGDPQSLSCTDPSAVGLDCSGFARWVYDLAYGQDVLGPGATRNQVAEMTPVSSPVPGDLVFFGSSISDTEHVGIYIGNNQMINAYDTGTDIQTNSLSDGGNLLGYFQY